MSFSMVSWKARQIMINDPHKPLRLMFIRIDGSLELRVDDISFSMSPYEMSDFPNRSLPGRRHIKVKRLENEEGTERTFTKYWDNPTGSFNNFIKVAQEVRGIVKLNGIIFALRDLPCHIWKLHDILRPVKISEISFDELTDKHDRHIYGVVRKIIEYILPNNSFCISFDPFKSVARNQTLHKKLQKQRKAWMSRKFDRFILYNFPVSLEDVINMRSRKVYCKSYWTKRMMRTFCEKWTDDNDSNLEWMQMENPRLFGPDKNIESVLSGLKYVKTKREFDTVNVHADERFHTTKVGYDICRKDGTLASIFHVDHNKMEIYVHTVKQGQNSLVGITYNIGCVFPSNELQIYQSRHEISPWGSYNEGQYEVSSKMIDEYDNVFVVYDWTLIVIPGTANFFHMRFCFL
ncbi:Protein CBG27691 [Caenorhabditis briggsae]|uniref:Protein CBG27691 n=1 Tax=Caenorhabditis briggsae TaxID=6238 RepID=B6IJD6_CAEBR|nr:Protein CBG27691 [Caenorhabditis briggsae]CAR99970.1 Protein CBG27691 [Caenorhabditis briggsae]